MATSFAFQWPSQVESLMAAQKVIASIGNSIVSVDCLAHDSGNRMSMFFLKSLLYAFIPVIYVVFAMFIIGCWYLVTTRYLRREVNMETMRSTIITAVIVFLFFRTNVCVLLYLAL